MFELEFPTVRVGDIPFAVTTPEQVLTCLRLSATRGVPVAFRFSNAYCVSLARADRTYRQHFRLAHSIAFPDGVPVVKAMNALARGLGASRIRGPSFFKLALSRGSDLDHFFLGGVSQEKVADALSAIAKERPLSVAGIWSPQIPRIDEEVVVEISDRVRASGANVLWLGLGTPKQDYLASELSLRLSIPVLGVGAAFDFLTGDQREAPDWLGRIGLEWGFRLMTDPRRLWRRYLIGNYRFLRIVGRQLLTKNSNYA